MTERPGHGLDEYLAKLNMLPREVHVTHTLSTMTQSTMPSDPQKDLDALVDKVSEVLARRQDQGL